MKLSQLYEVKPICLIASDNVLIDGDVVFHKGDFDHFIGDFTHAIGAENKSNITIKNCFVATQFPKKSPLKIKMLWLWYMVILNKSHVYLTGVLN